jgi:hypothetical protein
LVTQPKVVFADEPTRALDSFNGERVMRLLVSAAKETSAAVVLVTHEARGAAEAFVGAIPGLAVGAVMFVVARNGGIFAGDIRPEWMFVVLTGAIALQTLFIPARSRYSPPDSKPQPVWVSMYGADTADSQHLLTYLNAVPGVGTVSVDGQGFRLAVRRHRSRYLRRRAEADVGQFVCRRRRVRRCWKVDEFEQRRVRAARRAAGDVHVRPVDDADHHGCVLDVAAESDAGQPQGHVDMG